MGSEGGIREMGSCELRVGVMVRFWDEDEEEEGKAGGRKRQVNHLFSLEAVKCSRLSAGRAAGKGAYSRDKENCEICQ